MSRLICRVCNLTPAEPGDVRCASCRPAVAVSSGPDWDEAVEAAMVAVHGGPWAGGDTDYQRRERDKFRRVLVAAYPALTRQAVGTVMEYRHQPDCEWVTNNAGCTCGLHDFMEANTAALAVAAERERIATGIGRIGDAVIWDRKDERWRSHSGVILRDEATRIARAEPETTP